MAATHLGAASLQNKEKTKKIATTQQVNGYRTRLLDIDLKLVTYKNATINVHRRWNNKPTDSDYVFDIGMLTNVIHSLQKQL